MDRIALGRRADRRGQRERGWKNVPVAGSVYLSHGMTDTKSILESPRADIIVVIGGVVGKVKLMKYSCCELYR